MPNQTNRKKLTKALIASFEPLEKEYAVWDTECPAFGVRVLPSGTKSFFVFYRNTQRDKKRRSLGSVRTVSVSDARRQAQAALADVRRGADPFEKLAELNSIPKLVEFWPSFLQDHALPNKSPHSLRADQSLWKNWLKPKFGKLRLNEIRRREVVSWHKSHSDNPIAANRALALLSRIMTFAIEYELISTNPCFKVQRFPETEREFKLSKAECRQLLEAIEKDADKTAGATTKLLLLTGARCGEVLKAQWSEFDLEAGTWTVPRQHIKNGIKKKIDIKRSLSNPALELLTEWRGQMSFREEGLVFPGCVDPQKPRYDIRKFWNRIRLTTGFHDLRLHDLRHAFASLAIDAGMSLDKLGLEMGHRSSQTARRYASSVKERPQTAADLVADALFGDAD